MPTANRILSAVQDVANVAPAAARSRLREEENIETMHRSLVVLIPMVTVLVACSAPAPAAVPGSTPTAPPAAAKPRIKFAFTSATDFSHIPILMALDELKKQGYETEPINFAQSETALEAVAKNEVQLGVGGAEVMKAIQKGAPMKLVGERNNNEFVIESTKAINGCADLEGKKVAIHSTGSGQTIQLNHWMKDKCPQVKPNILVISGGENRAAAMLAGQIDATPLQIADSIKVEQDPRFHRLVNFSAELPNLISGDVHASNQFLAENRPAVKAFLKAQVEANRKVMGDPKVFAEMEQKYLPEVDPQLLPLMIKAYTDINGFQLNGGLTVARVKYTIDFTVAAGGLEPGLTPEQVADTGPLDEVLQEIGRR